MFLRMAEKALKKMQDIEAIHLDLKEIEELFIA